MPFTIADLPTPEFKRVESKPVQDRGLCIHHLNAIAVGDRETLLDVGTDLSFGEVCIKEKMNTTCCLQRGMKLQPLSPVLAKRSS